jgi:hypothetical protein
MIGERSVGYISAQIVGAILAIQWTKYFNNKDKLDNR